MMKILSKVLADYPEELRGDVSMHLHKEVFHLSSHFHFPPLTIQHLEKSIKKGFADIATAINRY